MPNNAVLVAFDTETTGLDPELQQIIEIAGVKFTIEQQGDRMMPQILGTFQSLVKPTMLIPAEASRINHITDAMVEDAPPIQTVLPDFVRFCGLSSVLVAHNADFDCRFLARSIARHQLLALRNPVLDSLKISRKLHAEYPNHKLATLARQLERAGRINLKVQGDNLHRALYDCEVLAQVVTALLSERIPPKEFGLATFLKAAEKLHGPAGFIKYEYETMSTPAKPLRRSANDEVDDDGPYRCPRCGLVIGDPADAYDHDKEACPKPPSRV
jgi:DNA polymerase-3 subunit alpha (Gram-positive type)